MSGDKRKWLPLATSPVIGNPKGNTLQELHYQSRCIDMVAAHEAEERRGVQCARVLTCTRAPSQARPGQATPRHAKPSQAAAVPYLLTGCARTALLGHRAYRT